MAHILLFDSGVGGLSVARAIREYLPQSSISYLFDNAYFPYGELEDSVLIDRVVTLVCDAVIKLSIDIVVIACNSASTLTLPALRERLAIPVVGVVPAIKPAATLSKTKHIGLVATPGTIKRDYTAKLVESFASQCRVSLLGSTTMVQLAEMKLRGEPFSQDVLASVFAAWQQELSERPDIIVLGCTHFPLLRDELEGVFGSGVTLIDSGAAIAKRVAHFVTQCTQSASFVEVHTLYTKADSSIDKLVSAFQEYGLAMPKLYSEPAIV
jgi:glutamate racemase